MSESKHTKGPWRVDGTRALGAYGVWTDYPTHPGDDGAGYPSQICAVIGSRPSEIPREQRDANAALIAAAPDLLAALEEASERLYSYYDHADDSTAGAIYETCRAAIRKARGEA